MKNIYVGNLDFNASEEQVRALFEQYGSVDNVTLVRDRDTGQGDAGGGSHHRHR